MGYHQRVASGELKENEIATGLILKPPSAAIGISGLECGWSAMPVALPGHGKCVCIVYKPAFEMMRQALRRADIRAAEVSSNYGSAVGCAPPGTKCTAQLAIDGATHRGREKKTVIFGGWVGRILDRDRRGLCNNYNGLFKLVCEGESLNAAALAFDVGKRACADIHGANLEDFAHHVLKDDGRGLEAGILWQMEESESQDLSALGRYNIRTTP